MAIWAPLHNLLGYIFVIKACIDNWKKNLLNSNISSTCPHNMVNFSLLAAEICWRVWGTPTNFNRFHVLASLLQRRRSAEANHTLQDDWPSHGLVHYIYIFWGCCPITEFARCKVYFASKFCALLYCLHSCPALKQWQSAKPCGMVQAMKLQNFRWGRHLYSAGQPSCWASAHILVFLGFFV